MKRPFILGIITGLFLLTVAGLSYYVQSAAFMKRAADFAAGVAAEKLGVRVDVGEIEISSLHELTVRQVALYDKLKQPIATVETARVGFGLLAMLEESPLAGIKEVDLAGVEALVEERSDGSWNVMDLSSGESSEVDFRGKIKVEDATLTGKTDGRELTLEDTKVTADFADYPALEVDVAAKNQGADIALKGTLSEERQIICGEVNKLTAENYLALLPKDLLPENIEIIGASLDRLQVDAMRYRGQLSFTGRAEYSHGRVKVLDTLVEDIRGYAAFNERDAYIATDAAANGQAAHVAGKISWASGVPYLNLNATAKDFHPDMILTDIPFRGGVDVEAAVTGTPQNPTVDGDIKIARGEVEGIPMVATNIVSHVRYEDNAVAWQDLRASILGGAIKGEGEFLPEDMSFTVHVVADDINLAAIPIEYRSQLEDLTGRAGGDVVLSGMVSDLTALKIYGSARAKEVKSHGLTVEEADTSFYVDGDDVTIDYLSLLMPNRSHIGLEGTIMDGRKLDLAFYGGHVDLALINLLAPQAACRGWGDFKGEVHGDSANPHLDLKFSGLRGELLHQPFDSVKASLSGSLDGVGVEEFSLEKGGKERWLAKGSVGFTGEKRLDLQIDCMDARMEDIAALVAPDQPITGNVSNTIRIRGTLDSPEAVGYIHFNRGSYGGMLLSGMDGDYTLSNGIVNLQDFHIFSPLVDMDVNGTVDQANNLNLIASVHDIDMKRFQSKFPYPVSGHGTFEGHILGNLATPIFDGELKSSEIILNEIPLTDVHGRITYRGQTLHLFEMGITCGSGKAGLDISLNTVTKSLFGKADITNFSINSILALLNQKEDAIEGALTCGVKVSGTLENPTLLLEGNIPQGSVFGYDVHDIDLSVGLDDHVVHVEQLEGRQGENGHVKLQGLAQMDGPMNFDLTAKDLALGIFTKAAGLDMEIVGSASAKAKISGYTQNPEVDMELTALNGGVKGTTFDSLLGRAQLKNGIIDLKELLIKKRVGEDNYQASAGGIVPLKALTAGEDEELAGFEQIKLGINLDEADLSLLPVLSDYIEWAVGDMDGHLTVTGTSAHPLINGNIAVPTGSLKIKHVEKPITDMGVNIIFSGQEMQVEKFTGNMGSGKYDLTGKLALAGRSVADYDFNLSMDKLDMQTSFYRGPITADLRFNVGEVFGKRLPKLSGSLDFDNCMVSVPTLPEDDGEIPHILLDVGVNLGKKVHFYSAYLADMYLTGNIHFGQSTRYPKSSGTIAVRRGGTLNYLKTVFKIREGEARFDQVNSFLPSLSLYADTKLNQAKVFLSVEGPLGAAKFSLTSSPEMSETELIQLLTLRDAYQKGKKDITVGDIVSLGLQMTVLSEIESTVI